MLFSGYKNVLDIFRGQRGLTNCLIFIDILEGQKRQGWVFQVGDRKSCRKIRTNNRKRNTVHKQKTQQQQQNKKQHHKQQQKQHGSKSNTSINKNSTQQKASIKQQQKWKKEHNKATKAVQTFWKVKSGKGVFLTQHNRSKEARMRGAKPRTNQGQEVWGLKGGGGRREEAPWKFGGIPANFVSIG